MTTVQTDMTTFERVLREEGEAILGLLGNYTESYATAARWIVESEGRVITCGIGKSGHIARKIAGTLSSTGTPSMFVHAAEAVHGDLGAVTSQDIVLSYSHSGETDEIVKLFPSLSKIGVRTILMTGRPESTAAGLATLVLPTGVQKEACSNNLAPTTSTTVMLAASDALAIQVMEMRGFQPADFAMFHPSGSLGRRLLLKVADVMRSGEDNPCVTAETALLDVLKFISKAGAGAACVISESGKMIGVITDGDIRRHILAHSDPLKSTAADVMSTEFQSLSPEIMAVDALEVFQNFPKKIGEIPVLDSEGRPAGMLSLKDLLRSGIF